MGEAVLKDASVVINAVDLSDHVRQVTINYGAEVKDITAMGDSTREKLAGLIDWSATLEFNQDFDAGEVDATLFSLVGAAAVTATFKPTSAAVSATNPSFSGSILVESYTPISGTVGDAHAVSVTLQGTGTLTRATA